jgi:hypothetical protein
MMTTPLARPVVDNKKGGCNVKTIIPFSENHILDNPSRGFYAWCYESDLEGILETGMGKIKFGQYGTNTTFGKIPKETINDYYKAMGQVVVILWVYPFTDKDLELYTPLEAEQLVNKNIGQLVRDGGGREMFYTSVDQIQREASLVLNTDVSRKRFIPSPDNTTAIEMMQKNRNKYFGLFAYMRHGKSFDYLEYVMEAYVKLGKFCNHVIFCHDTKTYDGWKDKRRKYYQDDIGIIELKDNKDYDFSRVPDRNTIIIISPQLISARADDSGNANFNEKLEALKNAYNIRAENIFVDEAHNYFTPQWEAYYESILTDGQIILATGTGINLLIAHQDKFDETNTFFWGFKEFQKRLLTQLNIDLRPQIKHAKLTDAHGVPFNIANLQSVDDGVLVNQLLFEEFVNHSLLNFNSTDCPFYDAKHSVILFDTVGAAREFKRLLQEHEQADKFIPILVAGSKNRDAHTESQVNEIIARADREGKRTITITCGSMIQGVSVRSWKNMVNLSSDSTYVLYKQFEARGFEFDSELDNYTGKDKYTSRPTMWDFNDHRIYKVAAEFVDAMAKINGGNQEEPMKYFYGTVDITKWMKDGDAWVKVSTDSYDTFASKVNEIVNKHTLARGLTLNTCLDRSFSVGSLGATWTEFAISLGKISTKVASRVEEYIALWNSTTDKQTTDHSKSSGDAKDIRKDKDFLSLDEQVKKAFERALNRLDIVFAVYKAQGKMNNHISELFNYYDDETFLIGMGFPNAEVSQVFVDAIKKHGLIDKINGKLNNNRIKTISELLNLDKDAFFAATDELDKMYTYEGDNTQLSTRHSYDILKKELKSIKAKYGQTFSVEHAKSGAINLALAYVLKEDSKKIFGSQLTNDEIINSIGYKENNNFFNSLNNCMGFAETKMIKPDFIIINPPYKGGLHIEIFNEAFERLNDGGTIICIHPATPFINRKPTKDDTKTARIKEIVSTYKTRLTLVDGNKLFDAGFFVPLSITHVEKVLDENIEVIYSHNDSTNKEIKVYDTLDNIFIHGNDIVLSIRDKIFSKMDESLETGLYRNGKVSTKYYALCRYSGHPPKKEQTTVNPDFYQLVYKTNEHDYSSLLLDKARNRSEQRGGNQFNDYALRSTDDVHHFHNYILTKFARFAVSINKISATLDCKELSSVPRMDFSQEWTDEKLFDYFELTQEERNFINEYIPDWYGRDFIK